MKMCRYFFNAIVALASIWTFTGCANNQPAGAAANANSSARTYDSQDLNRTGKRTTGEALQAADASVTATSGR